MTALCLIAVVLVNVLSFYEPLRAMIRAGIDEGFIEPRNECLAIFVDGPPRPSSVDTSPESREEWVKSHESFDWGNASLEALDGWNAQKSGHVWKYPFDWTRKLESAGSQDEGRMAGA